MNIVPGAYFNMDMLKTMADESDEIVLVTNSEKVLYANKKCENALGYLRGEMSNISLKSGLIFPTEAVDEIQYLCINHSIINSKKSFECDFLSKTGNKVGTMLTLIPIKDNNQSILLCTANEIGEKMQNERTAQGFSVSGTADTIFLIDRDFRVILDNRKKYEINKSEVIGSEINANVSNDTSASDSTMHEYNWVFETGKTMITEEIIIVNSQETYCETRKIPIYENGKAVKIAVVIRDVTETRNHEKELELLNQKLLDSNDRLTKLAFTDTHTGLFNHRYLMETIETEYFRAKRTGKSLSIVMMDIDNFKSINDVYGHQFGDLILTQFAKKIKLAAREQDTAVRFGGEEFAIVCLDTDRISAILFGQRLIDEVSNGLFGNSKNRIRVTFSASIVSYPEDNVRNASELLGLANQLLNKAKEYGGNRVYSSLDISRITDRGFKDGDATNIKEKIERLNKRMSQSMVEAVFAFSKSTSIKDNYSVELLEQIVYLAIKLAERMAVPKEDINLIKQAVLLRDLGKVSISETILTKTEKLTNKEMSLLKEHPIISADIIRPVHTLYSVLPFVLYHHEHWDGKGYPLGMKDEEIPVGAQIVSIVDTFQALISDRPYHKAFGKDATIKILNESSGTQFNPYMVEKFLSVI